MNIISFSTDPLVLRLFLFLGMVLHKAVWEILKRREGLRDEEKQSEPWGLKRLVKLAKSAFLVFLLIQTLFLDVLPISSNPTTLRVIGTVIYTIGLGIAVIGRIQLGDNWVDLEDARVLPDQKIVRSGVYRFIRHPIYFGDLLLVFGLELALNSWLVLLIPFLGFVIIKQARDEEAILANAFPDYQNYQRETKMFIPGIL